MEEQMIIIERVDAELEVAVASDKGPRGSNQDAASASGRRVGVFDGVGGHGGGDRASRAAAQAFIAGAHANLADAMLAAHVGVLAAQEAANCRCLTTAVIAEVQGEAASWSSQQKLATRSGPRKLAVTLAWSGDSRGYVRRSSGLEQLTRDHGYGRFVSKCLGHERDWRPDLTRSFIAPDDILLLSTDGLHDTVSGERIAELLGRQAPLAELAQDLVDEALASGTRDNVTVLLLRQK